MRMKQVWARSAIAAACAMGPLTAQVPPSEFVNFEGAQTNPIRISADGTRLFAVNTPNGTVSVFDLHNAFQSSADRGNPRGYRAGFGQYQSQCRGQR